jgi:hypothetical protein
MPQYTIKLHTYDPDIVEAFERLRKNRKQAAFTHEALKHFIASGKASPMIALMSNGHRSPQLKAATGTKHQETTRDAVPPGPSHRPVAPLIETKRACDDVLKKILE